MYIIMTNVYPENFNEENQHPIDMYHLLLPNLANTGHVRHSTVDFFKPLNKLHHILTPW